MKPDRIFYASAGALFLVLMLIGFRRFIASGTHVDGGPIDPAIRWVVVLHGAAIAAWFVLFFVQSLLITTRNRKLHMKLGWSVLVIGATITCTGTLVAIRSVQVTPADFRFFNMEYKRFLLVMLTEIALYTAFVTAGVLARRRPRIHRPMMLMASLAILAGATARIPFCWSVFGQNGWEGLFGPVFCLGGVLLLVRLAMTRTLDRWFAAGYALLVVAYIASEKLSLTSIWMGWADAVLKL
jgi:hypothetical protein